MRRKTGYKILLAAMMALAIANVYVGKALDVHANDPLSRAECAASGSDATVEEYCLICHFHLAACTEAESFLPTLVTLFEERLYRCYLAGGSSPVLHGYGLRCTSRRGLTFRRRMYVSGPVQPIPRSVSGHSLSIKSIA